MTASAKIITIVSIIAAFIAMITIGSLVKSDDAPKRERPNSVSLPKADIKPEQPKDGVAYVWSMPTTGHQSIVVLNVVDNTTIDAAYLVPVRLKLRGMSANATKESIEKLIAGQLRTAFLLGVDSTGAGIVDIWINEKNAWISDASK